MKNGHYSLKKRLLAAILTLLLMPIAALAELPSVVISQPFRAADLLDVADSLITVTFTAEGSDPVEISVAAGETIGSQMPADPSREGYRFDGWFAGDVQVTADTTVTEAFTAVASFTAITYSVTFVQDDGTKVTRTTSVEKGYVVSDLPEVTPVANKIGKWVYPGTTNEFKAGTVITANQTVNAYYEQSIFTVEYLVDGAHYDQLTTDAGTAIVLPADPVKTGTTFQGWFTEPDGKGIQYTAESTVSQDLTLYASFSNQVFDVSNMISDEDLPENAQLLAEILDEMNEDRKIDIYISSENDTIVFGDEVTLHAVLRGYDDCEFTAQWQISDDDVNYVDIDGENELTCSFIVTEQNYTKYWRMVTTITAVNIPDEVLQEIQD